MTYYKCTYSIENIHNKYIKHFVVSVIMDDPEFTEPIVNVTVPAGRSVKLGCSVRNLGSYKVWDTLFHRKSNTCLILRYLSYIYIYILYFSFYRNQNPLFWLNPERKKNTLFTHCHIIWIWRINRVYMLFFGRKVIFQSNLP